MRALRRPTRDAVAVFRTCTSRTRGADRRAALAAAEPKIRAAALAYEAAAQAGLLYTIPAVEEVGPSLNGRGMQTVYASGMVGGPGRFVYEELLASTRKCPLCAQRQVTTIDHHLPKGRYPALAVTPTNLVPCCTDCNFAKGEHSPGVAEEQTFHPYFDNVGPGVWLRAQLVLGSPPALVFEVDPPASWDTVIARRIAYHFDLLGLGALYAAEAAEELLNVRDAYARLHAIGGANAVRDDLHERARSCAGNYENSWQSATYRALAGSAWYCEGGFAMTLPTSAWRPHAAVTAVPR